jgi:uncharacterized membrane protein YqaE (UPF0057 family)
VSEIGKAYINAACPEQSLASISAIHIYICSTSHTSLPPANHFPRLSVQHRQHAFHRIVSIVFLSSRRLFRALWVSVNSSGNTNVDARTNLVPSDIVKIIIAILLPPLGVFLERGCGADLLINILLTILGYIPGIIHALYVTSPPVLIPNPHLLTYFAVISSSSIEMAGHSLQQLTS